MDLCPHAPKLPKLAKLAKLARPTTKALKRYIHIVESEVGVRED